MNARVLALLVVLSTVGGSFVMAFPAAAEDGDGLFVKVSTAVDPDPPTPGKEFSLNVTLDSAEQSDVSAVVDRITVSAEGPDGKTYYTGYSKGLVNPGYATTIDLPVRIKTAGTHALEIDVWLTSARGQTYHVVHTVEVPVYDVPLVDAEFRRTAPGRETELNVTVANGFNVSIRNVVVELESDDVALDRTRRIASAIAADSERVFTFPARVTETGEHLVRAKIAYTNETGVRKQLKTTLTPSFTLPEVTDQIKTVAHVAPSLPGASTTLNVTISNGLAAPLRQLSLAVSADGVAIPQPERLVGQLPSGDARTFSFQVTAQESGTKAVTAVLEYTTADGIHYVEERVLHTAFTEPANPGDVRLTGVSVVREGDVLHVSGTASNTGGSPVTGAVVSVGSNGHVSPADSKSDFFVGTVDASDFVSFDVYAKLDGNATSVEVPLEIRYMIDDTEQTRAVDVSYRAAQTSTNGKPAQAGVPLVAIGGGLLVVALAAAFVVRRRR